MNVIDSSAWLEYFAAGPNASSFTGAIENTVELIVPTISIYEVFKRILQQRKRMILLTLVVLLYTSCTSNHSVVQDNDAIINNYIKTTDMQYFVSNYIAPSSIYFTVSEFKDISSDNSVYYYYHTLNRDNLVIFVIDKYMPFKRVIERNSQVISDASLRLLKNTICYFDKDGRSNILKYDIDQKSPFEYTLSSKKISIEEFGNFDFLNVIKIHNSISLISKTINNEEKEVLEILGNGYRRFKRKESIETITNFETMEIYMKDIGLYYSDEVFHYPQREGVVYRRKIEVEELKKLLNESRMPFYYNNEP